MRPEALYYVTAYRSSDAPIGGYFAANRRPFASLDDALHYASGCVGTDDFAHTGIVWHVETRNGRVYYMSSELSFPPINAEHFWKDGVTAIHIEHRERAAACVVAERREGNDVPDLALASE